MEGTNGDEENPLGRFLGSQTDEENTSCNSENTEGDNTKQSESYQGMLINLISAYCIPSIRALNFHVIVTMHV